MSWTGSKRVKKVGHDSIYHAPIIDMYYGISPKHSGKRTPLRKSLKEAEKDLSGVIWES